MIVRQAGIEDVPEILSLYTANHISRLAEDERDNGFVSVLFQAAELEAFIEELDAISVSVYDGHVVASAIATPWEPWLGKAFFQQMVKKLVSCEYEGIALTTENTYPYGPVCVAKEMRGSGCFQELFQHSLGQMSERYPYMVTFVHKKNPRSLQAHIRKAGMDVLGEFKFDGNEYVLLICRTR